MKALIFGSIGTICSSSDVQLAGYNNAFSEVGLDWYWDEVTYRGLLAITGGKQRLQHYASQTGMAPLEHDLLDRIHSHKTEHYVDNLQLGVGEARPGVLRLISAAKAEGIKLAFVTTTERRNIEAISQALAPEFDSSNFDVITDRDMVSAEKPDSEAYHVALKSLSCDPGDAIAIEDTQACVSAAVNAGIACIATPHQYSLAQSFDEANAVLNHLGDPWAPSQLLRGELALDNGMVTLDGLSTVITGQADAA